MTAANSRILILKLGALGDVIRTTPLLRVLQGDITWITSAMARPLLENNGRIHRLLTADNGAAAAIAGESYDLVLNLEDGRAEAELASSVAAQRIVGPYFSGGELTYCPQGADWFDMSLSSRFGRAEADRIKMRNRRTYQEMLFASLGLEFRGEEPLVDLGLANALEPGLIGIEERAGNVWPSKRWRGYQELAARLERRGYRTRFFQQRDTLEEYAADINACEAVICGDTLAMHVALMLGRKVVTIFTCTSPHEIYGYSRMAKVVSPLLEQYFYRREYSPEPADAIAVDTVEESFLSLTAGVRGKATGSR